MTSMPSIPAAANAPGVMTTLTNAGTIASFAWTLFSVARWGKDAYYGGDIPKIFWPSSTADLLHKMFRSHANVVVCGAACSAVTWHLISNPIQTVCPHCGRAISSQHPALKWWMGCSAVIIAGVAFFGRPAADSSYSSSSSASPASPVDPLVKHVIFDNIITHLKKEIQIRMCKVNDPCPQWCRKNSEVINLKPGESKPSTEIGYADGIFQFCVGFTPAWYQPFSNLVPCSTARYGDTIVMAELLKSIKIVDEK